MTPPAPPLTVTVARIDLGAIRHNARLLARQAGASRLMAVVKADAYGHGAAPVSQMLERDGVRDFAVATVAEGVALRRAGVGGRILVFAPPQPAFLEAYAAHNLEASIPSLEGARMVRASGLPLAVHLKVDTGMHRLGVAPAEVADAVALLDAPPLRLAALWTHYATADETGDTFADRQREKLLAARACAPHVPVHAANSASVITGHGTVEGADVVRCGVALYGLPAPEESRVGGESLRPAMQFVSQVVAVRRVAAGEGVSYGLAWRAPAPTWIATVGAGYADGVRRGLSERGEVGIGGRRYPIAGRVCMDAFMVAAGPADEPCPVAVGDEVVLWGPGGPSAAQVAGWLGTIPYEVACGVGARVPRLYP